MSLLLKLVTEKKKTFSMIQNGLCAQQILSPARHFSCAERDTSLTPVRIILVPYFSPDEA